MKVKFAVVLSVLLMTVVYLAAGYRNAPNRPSDFRDEPGGGDYIPDVPPPTTTASQDEAKTGTPEAIVAEMEQAKPENTAAAVLTKAGYTPGSYTREFVRGAFQARIVGAKNMKDLEAAYDNHFNASNKSGGKYPRIAELRALHICPGVPL